LGLERGYIWENLGYLKTVPLTNHWPECALIFGMKQPWDKETQLCANKVPVVTNGPAQRGPSYFCIGLYKCT